MEGVPASEVKEELRANAARRDELSAKLAAAGWAITLWMVYAAPNLVAGLAPGATMKSYSSRLCWP